MKKLNQGLLAAVLLTAGFAAMANGVNNKSPRPYAGNHHNMVYSVTEQTTQPNETIKKLVNNVPKIEDGKRYMIRVSVVEIPEQAPMKQPTAPVSIPAPAAK